MTNSEMTLTDGIEGVVNSTAVTCNDVEATYLPKYSQGKISGEEKELLEMHTAVCEPCKRLYNKDKMLNSMLARYGKLRKQLSEEKKITKFTVLKYKLKLKLLNFQKYLIKY